ncbi:MAG: lanthionine synthetase LanC family protein [Gaiellales bacterium]
MPKGTALATVCLLALVAAPELTFRQASQSKRPYLEAALETAKWLEGTAVKTAHGLTWPAVPGDPATVTSNLYAGSAGVVLFFLEAHRATGERRYLERARAGADHLAATFDQTADSGLCTGLAGLCYTLGETARATGVRAYSGAARRCTARLRERAKRIGAGIEWNDTTDIIGGGAGIGSFLLHAAREFDGAASRDAAIQAGRRLVSLARREPTGVSWRMNPSFPRVMPNFSHGTAGIAYFLATLAAETRQKEFLKPAVDGARHVQSIATTANDVCLVMHNAPEGTDLFYLGWCHGPAGTARLFQQLHRVTGAAEWRTWVDRSARGILTSGIPETQTPGFWNNVGQCCGSAGVGEFLLALHRATGREEYLAFARRLTDNLLARGTRDSEGLRWTHAEHRVRPELLQAQTGFMQGAAGIGTWLLHLDAFERKRRPLITLPDSPF